MFGKGLREKCISEMSAEILVNERQKFKLIKRNWSQENEEFCNWFTSISAIGLISVPALADEANVQTSGQFSTQIGDKNTSTQRTNQSNTSIRRVRRENVGSAQDSIQDAFQEGNGNESEQSVNQRNVNRRSRR